jgi:hypothetical protein
VILTAELYPGNINFKGDLMEKPETQTYTAFNEQKLFAHGPLDKVVLQLRAAQKKDPSSSILVFSDSTGKQMDFDLSGSEKDVLQRLKVFVPDSEPSGTSGPGRPKLGVISREVSLLPRHWEWLSTQSGGASAVLRRLVDEAIKKTANVSEIKQAQERTYKVLSAMAGNLPQYEEALRALFAKDKKKFELHLKEWPNDVKKYALKLSEPAFR